MTDDWALTALAPSAVDLLAEHATSQLVLTEQGSGRVVDRRSLWPGTSKTACEDGPLMLDQQRFAAASNFPTKSVVQ